MPLQRWANGKLEDFTPEEEAAYQKWTATLKDPPPSVSVEDRVAALESKVVTLRKDLDDAKAKLAASGNGGKDVAPNPGKAPGLS